MSSGNRVVLMIDGDNVPADHSDEILRLSELEGTLLIRRVYGDALLQPKWEAVPALEFIHAGRGKNATDLLIAIDAMEIALGNPPETFVLASSDGDFSHLAHRLRSRGHQVIGMGEAKAPASFAKACTSWRCLERPLPVRTQDLESPSDLDDKIKAAIMRHSKHGSGTLISLLSTEMKRDHNFKISEHEDKTWRGYLSKRPAFFDVDPKGPEARVRFRSDAFRDKVPS